MPRLKPLAGIVLVAIGIFVAHAFAQEIPSLSISPAKATMLVGETRTFRAVGKDGRLRHNIRWSISPQNAATLSTNSDEVNVQAEQVSSVILTANAEGDSAEATLEIRSGTLSNGTIIWSVQQMPGCKEKKMTQAVPSATGPDLYVEEECPQGNFVRALTADGRELWRRQITGRGGVLESPAAKPQAVEESGQHLSLQHSICESISSGMSKDEVSKLAAGRHLQVGQKERESNMWNFEEEGSHCAISFDGKTAIVLKKKKTLVID